ncbi:MAG: hypothetical protein KatS3mg015_0407 [Fimbriimonadales bacterium]|nr:MAG: hypothetical protein KatS3mg015_0407 [Fimbriimonadales bacterium]
MRERCRRAVHVLMPNGEAVAAGRAVLYVLGCLPGYGWTRALKYPPLVWAVELAYRIVAAIRPVLSRFVRA